jgi:hypothetical protein
MSTTTKILSRTFLAMNLMGGVSAAVRTDAINEGLAAHWNRKMPNQDAGDRQAMTALRYGTALIANGPLMTYADMTGNYTATVEGMPVHMPRTPDGFIGEVLGWKERNPQTTLARLNQDAGTVFSFIYGTVSWPGQIAGSVAVEGVKDAAKALRPR